MSALSVNPPYPMFVGSNGEPLEDGFVYIGAAGQNPETNLIAVYWDAALTIPAAQPIRTLAGYPSRNGTPSPIYVNASDYSITLRDKNSKFVYYSANTTLRINAGVLGGLSASDISYTPPGSGAVPGTVADELNRPPRINAKRFGMDPAASASVNNDALEDALAYCGANGYTLYIPAGVYALSRAFDTTLDLHIEGDGDSTVLDFSGSIAGDYALQVSGSLTQLPQLASAASKNSMSLSFSSAPSLNPGDVFMIYNPTDYSYSGFRFYYRAGEWCECDGISGTTVSIDNPLYDGYVAAAVNLYKLSGPKVSLRNFRVKGTQVEGLICVTLCDRPVVENVSGYHENNSIVSFDRCYRPTAINLNLFNKGDGGDDYGLVIANSQHVQVIGGNYYARRHAITAGGGNDLGCVPCRNLRFTSLTTKNDINSGVFSADFHGNTEDSVYENCRIYGGATWQGKNNRYVNCVISNISTYVCVYSAEIKGGYFTLENCDLLVTGDPQLNTRGIVDIGGNNAAVTANTTEPTTFIVKNCRVSAPIASAITSLIMFKNRGCTQYVNFEIDGITALSAPSFGQILYTANISGTASSQFIIVDHIANFPVGTYLHNAAGGSYAGFPHRCQKQTGRVSMTATSGTNNTINSAISFKYPYPKEPSAQATTVGTYAGNRLAMASIGALTTSAITPRIDSPDAVDWAATVSRTVCWTASIDEV